MLHETTWQAPFKQICPVEQTVPFAPQAGLEPPSLPPLVPPSLALPWHTPFTHCCPNGHCVDELHCSEPPSRPPVPPSVALPWHTPFTHCWPIAHCIDELHWSEPPSPPPVPPSVALPWHTPFTHC
jgi:hypothetical protein